MKNFQKRKEYMKEYMKKRRSNNEFKKKKAREKSHIIRNTKTRILRKLRNLGKKPLQHTDNQILKK
jgi:myo-inositol-1-phosphate synthase